MTWNDLKVGTRVRSLWEDEEHSVGIGVVTSKTRTKVYVTFPGFPLRPGDRYNMEYDKDTASRYLEIWTPSWRK